MDVPEWYTTLLILPWDHAFAHTAGIYTLIASGASMASIQVGKTPMETLKNIPQNIKEIKPVFLLSVPALAKNFRKNIESGVRQKGKLANMLFSAGLSVSYAYNGIGWDRGNGLRFLLKPLHSLFDTILYSKIRENFGGRLKFFIGGGALLDIELQKFFYALGIPMFQGYGLSEASPIISSNSESRHKLGSSGYLVDNLELKICDENKMNFRLVKRERLWYVARM
jgi:long-chain acyl-CoA synthetase